MPADRCLSVRLRPHARCLCSAISALAVPDEHCWRRHEPGFALSFQCINIALKVIEDCWEELAVADPFDPGL